VRIFISSTFRDLRPEREAVRDVLSRRSRVTPWGMELFASSPEKPLKVCLEWLHMSDAVVLAIGFFAGSLIPESPELTYTRAEFELAQKLGRPVFAFFKTEGGVPLNKETDPEKKKALDDFKSAVSSADINPAYFDSTERLQLELVLALDEWDAKGHPGSRRYFTTPDEFFAPFRSDSPKLFDFKQTLRGRDAELRSLNEFLAGPKIVGLLTGRGGIGKSKLLHDWSQTVKDRAVLYVSDHPDWHSEVEKEIPASDVLIVVDEGHRLESLDQLLVLARALAKPDRSVKVLLGARPSGITRIDGILSARFDVGQVNRFPQLERVPNQSVRELALEVLGDGHSQHANALAAVSADTPLVTVVGGRLIARGDIPPALLAGEDEFRRQVFDRFSAEYEQLLPPGTVNWRKLLNLVAAVGPLAPTANSFLEPAAEIMRIGQDEIISALDVLEKHGLLLRGGRLIRIVPDLLSDFLLEGACITGAGESTRFSDLVFRKFQPDYLSNILRNLGELDWRITQRNPDQGARLLDAIWAEMEATFEAGNAYDRVQIFKVLKEVAPYQPTRVLRLIRRAIENEAAPKELLPDWQRTQEHVLREIPPLLRAVAFHFAHLEEAAGILWRLAQGERRPQHQYPDHARRVLEEMAEYNRSKPPQYNDWMADFAGRLSRDPQAFDSSFTPLSIVDKLLAKEGEFTESEGYTISFGGFGLNYAIVRPIREKALRTVEACLGSDNSRAALRATESVSRVLSGFLPAVGRRISDEEFRWQTGERIAVLDVVENRLKKPVPTALVRQIRSILRRSRPQTKDNPVAEKIGHILSNIPQSDDLVIFDSFSTGQWDLDVEHTDLEEADRARQQLISRGVDAFRRKFPDGRRQVDGLVELAKDAEACGIDLGNKPYNFIEELCSADFVGAFLPYIMNDSHPLLAQMVVVPLRWLRKSDLPRYRSLGIEAATHKNYLVAYGAANAVSYGPNLNAPLAEDVAILQALARHPAEAVRYLTLTGIRRLGAHEQYEREAIEMLLASEVGNDSKLADEMCGAADYAGINKDHLSEPQIHLLLDKLVITKDIDGHHTERFLSWVGQVHPDLLFEFILRRLDRDAEFDQRGEKRAGYTPISHHGFGNAFRPLQGGLRYRNFLEQVTDRFVTRPGQAFWLRGLFWAIGSIDATALGVIDELLHRGNAESARIALQLIEGGPNELALSRPCFAVHVIEECGRIDSHLGALAESVFLSNAQTGPFNRTSGQPSPRYVSMKEKSEALRDLFPVGSTGNRVFTHIRDVAMEMLNRERLDDEQVGF